MPSTKEYASQIITVNFGGTFAMKNNNDDEGIALLLMIALLITMTTVSYTHLTLPTKRIV